MSTRKEQKEALRQERQEREAQEAASARRKRLVGIGVGGALALAAVIAVAVVLLAGGDDAGSGGGDVFPKGGSVPKTAVTDLAQAAEAAGCTLRDEPVEGGDHVEGEVTYKSKPPHSGDHNIVPAEDGVFGEGPPEENFVHALEHGRINVQAKATIPAEQRSKVRALIAEDPYHMLLFADKSGMTFEVAATSWSADPSPRGEGHVLGCPKMNDKVFDAVRAFKEEYRDRGPENVP